MRTLHISFPISTKMNEALTAKDFETDQEERWCPGCGDYAILKQVRTVLAASGVPKEQLVFISGIGCSSRFPYYVDTYGMHSIHGRATAIATGLKITRPDLSVWVVTGDGDCLSIGGNHFIHVLRRNPNINILLFNNQIYGLTKGQYSPTSERNKVTKSSPHGTVDQSIQTALLALGAKAGFVSRSIDTESAHLRTVLQRADQHHGTSLVEIYQNCNIFNDGAFDQHKDKSTKATSNLILEQGKPLVFGEHASLGIRLDGISPKIVSLQEYSASELWIHDETDYQKALLLAQFHDKVDEEKQCQFPLPLGVLFADQRASYEDEVIALMGEEIQKRGKGDINQLIAGKQTWTIN